MNRTTTEPGTRLYLWSDRKINATLGLLRGVFDGVWLGVLDDDRIARIDEAFYSGQPMYEAEGYNRSGRLWWEGAVVAKHFADAVDDVVVTSAGGGREVLALAELGFRVTGYEPHERLVRFGRSLTTSSGDPLDMHVCERDRWPSAATAASGVIAGWGGYMLIRDRARRIAFLRAAAGVLPDGGPVLLSFFVREGRPRRLRVAATVANSLRRLLRRPPIDLGDALVPNRVHFFSRDEVESELARAGFDMVEFGSEDYGWAVGRKIAAERVEGAGGVT